MSDQPEVIFDDENPEWTEEDFARARPLHAFPELEAALRRGPGRPAKSESERKRLTSLRLSPDVIDALRATGAGWQARANEALRSAFVAK